MRMRRSAALTIAAILMAIVLAACGSNAETQNETAAAEPVPSKTEAPNTGQGPSKTDYSKDYTGSWKACGVSTEGEYISLEEIESYGVTDLSNIYLILYPDGSAEYYYLGGTDSGKWFAGEGGVRFLGTSFTKEDDYLYRIVNGDKLYFERISETAEKPVISAGLEGTKPDPKAGDEPAKTADPPKAAEPAGATDNKAEPDGSDAISPELKAFLESYESFMDEYCDFMEHYNASDFSQLAKYAELLQKYSDFAAKAEQWNSKDLNDAETIYYLEVMNRVSIKLLKVTQQ
ncbi:MAG: hypothetical protein IJM08_03230 [Firmicutes bacterium]|nr:hypothetical protein [Bacillota bacterium]